MKRRIFCKLATLFGAGFAISAAIKRQLPGKPQLTPEEKLQNNLLALFKHLPSAQAVGNEYLHTFPDASDAEILLSQICEGCEGGMNSLSQMNRRELQKWIRDRQQQDFAQGQTLTLKGWVLSKTEVQLCALVTLAKV